MRKDANRFPGRSHSAEPNEPKKVTLALQGGGAHGAFAWGVLDRLLEEDGIAFEGISATSAGAMNAVVCAYGLSVGGREGARTALRQFWAQIGRAGVPSLFQVSSITAGPRARRWRTLGLTCCSC